MCELKINFFDEDNDNVGCERERESDIRAIHAVNHGDLMSVSHANGPTDDENMINMRTFEFENSSICDDEKGEGRTLKKKPSQDDDCSCDSKGMKTRRRSASREDGCFSPAPTETRPQGHSQRANQNERGAHCTEIDPSDLDLRVRDLHCSDLHTGRDLRSSKGPSSVDQNSCYLDTSRLRQSDKTDILQNVSRRAVKI